MINVNESIRLVNLLTDREQLARQIDLSEKRAQSATDRTWRLAHRQVAEAAKARLAAIS